ncbi:hypothetical protein LptCag_0707 [Leptospirillum ferriphilum]|uniref:Uncharacterized protein n=1 Tax=Leptospirillum ferriphilum TaxID=178606 RepID=A0A094YLK2_9BACT|nr:hypothetical protein LptCag_0707 [Leptospirillum ferriphilum]
MLCAGGPKRRQDAKRRQILSCRKPAAFENDGTFKRARMNQKNKVQN